MAAKVVTTLRTAGQVKGGNWLKADTRAATDKEVIVAANRCQSVWAKPSEFLPAAAVRRDPARTRFLWVDEVMGLASMQWKEEQKLQKLPPEADGPPCARCDMDHETLKCPHFNRPRGVQSRENLTAGTLDSAYVRIMNDLHTMATTTPAANAPPNRASKLLWPQYHIVNTCTGTSSGEHWFTVAYSIRSC